MFGISEVITRDREYKESVDALCASYRAEEPLPIVINGLSGGARTAYLTEAVKDAVKVSAVPVLVLVGSGEEMEPLVERLCSSGLRAAAYKLRELIFYNVSASAELDRERLSVLSLLLRGELDVVVTTPAAMMSRTMPKGMLRELSLTVAVGDIVEPDDLCVRLTSLGFSPSDSTEGRGQFSRRGGIVDFWGANMDTPVRVEFFGDEIDRMVGFDPVSQRSLEPVDRVSMLPAHEVIIDKAARERVIKEINRLLGGKNLSTDTRDRLERERGAMSCGLPAFRDKYIGLIYEEMTTLWDYLGEGRKILFLLGTNDCKNNLKAYLDKLARDSGGFIESGALSRKTAVYSGAADGYDSILSENLAVHINTFAGGVSGLRLAGLFGFRCRSTVSYGDSLNMLREDLEGYLKGSYTIVLLTESRQEALALCDSLLGMDIIPQRGFEREEAPELLPGTVTVIVGSSEGFDLMTPRVAVLSMARDTGRALAAARRKRLVKRRTGGATREIMSYAELADGDYVVHASYGIGRFMGVEPVTVDGVTKDYITIQYAGTDRLFVPCDKLEMISKYIGDRESDGSVKLSVMGGGDWSRAKTRAKSAAKNIANKLIALYAQRQSKPGFAFPRGTELEDVFDSEFPFVETDSQLDAIEEIRRDMESSVPMNRLLCGDVGYGKTEVALRAAFKAVLGGKQVAILVPTTILAMQHYQTALSRMRGYAINVEMVSRHKRPKEREKILAAVAKGNVDILIGTHAIISKSVSFKDLGLLIIDEEQRFGVAQKERLREMATDVDTLMLSATPIPRTLNMAMSGISDISVLDEPPGERRPVITYVMEHDESMILDAIRRELDRRGQVLYLYNKIEDIDLVAGRIQDDLPKARVAYAHGRMDKDEIEDVWQSLVRGEIDILVCTTIIETGVDLPRANTLIIENADRFGLSQLHQIRGRVGRSERQAYAYLTYRPGKSLTEVAERRLETIREFAEFGAGFRIALRDMEIRGVGNLLGAEQHGYIESVGYDLYMKLLSEAVQEAKGIPAEEKREAKIEIKLSAHIPDTYISSSAVRMSMYKRIAHIESEADASDVADEFCDRFGDMPRTVQRLIDVALAKAMAERSGIDKVGFENGRLTFVSKAIDLGRWSGVFGKFKPMAALGYGVPAIVYTLHKGEDPAAMAAKILVAYDKEEK